MIATICAGKSIDQTRIHFAQAETQDGAGDRDHGPNGTSDSNVRWRRIAAQSSTAAS